MSIFSPRQGIVLLRVAILRPVHVCSTSIARCTQSNALGSLPSARVSLTDCLIITRCLARPKQGFRALAESSLVCRLKASVEGRGFKQPGEKPMLVILFLQLFLFCFVLQCWELNLGPMHARQVLQYWAFPSSVSLFSNNIFFSG